MGQPPPLTLARSKKKAQPRPQAPVAQHFDIGASLPDHLQPRNYNDLETNRRQIKQYLRNIEGMGADEVHTFMQNLESDVAIASMGR